MSDATPRRFRKKPVVIEAVRLTHENHDAVASWCGGSVCAVGDHCDYRLAVRIATLEGAMFAHAGDWIVKGVLGEFYPCDPTAFDMTYEEDSDE